MTNSESVVPSVPAASIDAPAPDFEARTTMGQVKMSDYRGRWLVFFSHPADFTPVCTSEFIMITSLDELVMTHYLIGK